MQEERGEWERMGRRRRREGELEKAMEECRREGQLLEAQVHIGQGNGRGVFLFFFLGGIRLRRFCSKLTGDLIQLG